MRIERLLAAASALAIAVSACQAAAAPSSNPNPTLSPRASAVASVSAPHRTAPAPEQPTPTLTPTLTAAPATETPAATRATPSPQLFSPMPTRFPSPAGTPTTTNAGADGAIWDRLPASFPIYPGMQRIDYPDPGPWTATLGIRAISAAELVGWYAQVLDSAGYRHDPPTGPMEDGSRGVTASAGKAGCRLSMSFVPRDTMTVVLIRLGASCPYR